MRLLTAEGMRNIDDALIICTNRPRTVAEHLLVTVFLLTGEQVTGVVDVAEPAEFTESPPVAARRWLRVPPLRKKSRPNNWRRYTRSRNSPRHHAITKLNNGEAYDGDATVFGKTYDAGYEPIKDASGTIIGAYFVGFAK